MRGGGRWDLRGRGWIARANRFSRIGRTVWMCKFIRVVLTPDIHGYPVYNRLRASSVHLTLPPPPLKVRYVYPLRRNKSGTWKKNKQLQPTVGPLLERFLRTLILNLSLPPSTGHSLSPSSCRGDLSLTSSPTSLIFTTEWYMHTHACTNKLELKFWTELKAKEGTWRNRSGSALGLYLSRALCLKLVVAYTASIVERISRPNPGVKDLFRGLV